MFETIQGLHCLWGPAGSESFGKIKMFSFLCCCGRRKLAETRFSGFEASAGVKKKQTYLDGFEHNEYAMKTSLERSYATA